MKYSFILILLITTSGFSFSQSTIKGKIIDKETGQPINSVIVCDALRPQNNTFSDSSGVFQIMVYDSITFRCLGYQAITKQKNNLQENSVVQLQPEIINLPEVTITKDDVGALLEESILNLKASLIYETPMLYLWHGKEEGKNTDFMREGYVSYIATLKKTDFKKNQLDYHLKALKVSQIHQDLQTDTACTRIVEAGLTRVMFHPSEVVDSKKLIENYNLSIDKSNELYLIIDCYPKVVRKKLPLSISITINRQDTVLLTIERRTINPTVENYSLLGVKRTSTHLSSLVQFKKGEKGYYLAQCLIKFGIIGEVRKNGERELELTHVVTAFPKEQPEFKGKLTDIDGRSASMKLFKLPSSTNEKFWEQNVK